MKKPVFILGAHKSGTSLVRALFDGHRNFFSVPIETHFFQHMQWWIDYPYRKTLPNGQISLDQFRTGIKQWIRHCNSSEDYQSDSVARGIFNTDAFDEYVDARLSGGRALPERAGDYFAVYMKGIFFSVNGYEMHGARRLVEKSVENAEFALDLKKMFPDACFVHVVRNPYAAIVAIRKYKATGSYPWLGPMYRTLYNSFYFLYRNRKLLEDYTILRYEDLVANPQATVQGLCEKIGADFDESLLSPTYLGRPWRGNSTAPVTFDAISAERVSAWKQDITHLEVHIVNRFLKHVVGDFGYETYETSRPPLFPVVREPVTNYIANRFLLKTG